MPAHREREIEPERLRDPECYLELHRRLAALQLTDNAPVDPDDIRDSALAQANRATALAQLIPKVRRITNHPIPNGNNSSVPARPIPIGSRHPSTLRMVPTGTTVATTATMTATTTSSGTTNGAEADEHDDDPASTRVPSERQRKPLMEVVAGALVGSATS